MAVVERAESKVSTGGDHIPSVPAPAPKINGESEKESDPKTKVELKDKPEFEHLKAFEDQLIRGDSSEKTIVIEGEDENEISFRSDGDLELDDLRLARMTDAHNRRFETNITTEQVQSIVQMVQENKRLASRLSKNHQTASKVRFSDNSTILERLSAVTETPQFVTTTIEQARGFYEKTQVHFRNKPLVSSLIFLVAVAFLCAILPALGVGFLAATAAAFATACWALCVASFAATVSISMALGVLSCAGMLGSVVFGVRFVRRFLLQQRSSAKK